VVVVVCVCVWGGWGWRDRKHERYVFSAVWGVERSGDSYKGEHSHKFHLSCRFACATKQSASEMIVTSTAASTVCVCALAKETHRPLSGSQGRWRMTREPSWNPTSRHGGTFAFLRCLSSIGGGSRRHHCCPAPHQAPWSPPARPRMATRR
jgi:hypothetical protein